jgi:ATP-dependent DNA helicase RecQ
VCLGELVAREDSAVLAQKILSCVVRCGQRDGAAHVSDVLRGSDNERVRRAGHTQLSTFGLLSEHSTRELRHWIDQLVGLEHLRAAPGAYPTLSLSPSGVEVLRGQRPVTLFALPQVPRASRAAARAFEQARGESAPSATPSDEALFERLRALRRRLAAERGVPPYLIFGDRTLALIAAQRPRNHDELLAVKGIGERKAQDLGNAVLALVREADGPTAAGS